MPPPDGNRYRPAGEFIAHESFPAHYSVLLSGPPGVGKFEYMTLDACRALELGERVVFVTLDLSPAEARARTRELRRDVEAHEGTSFVFVDCYSNSFGDRAPEPPSKRVFVVSSFGNLEGIGITISKAAQELGTPVRIFLYSLSTLFLHNSAQAIAKFLQIVTARAKTTLGFIMYAVHEGVHDAMTMNLLRSLVDGVVEMRFSEGVGREARTHHMRGRWVDATWRTFDPFSRAVVEPIQ